MLVIYAHAQNLVEKKTLIVVICFAYLNKKRVVSSVSHTQLSNTNVTYVSALKVAYDMMQDVIP
jgi:hypothetical protein